MPVSILLTENGKTTRICFLNPENSDETISLEKENLSAKDVLELLNRFGIIYLYEM